MSDYKNLKLDKSFYTSGKGFTQALEELDPSENYKGTSLEGLDAYQRQLKRFGIRVGGINSDTVEKFFKTSDSAALFPEYVNRAVRQGIEKANKLDRIIATTTKIDSLDYRSITSVSDDDSKELKDVEEGGEIPSTTVKIQENLVKLNKRGRMLVASYEAVRFQRLDFSLSHSDRLAHTLPVHSLKTPLRFLLTATATKTQRRLFQPAVQRHLHTPI